MSGGAEMESASGVLTDAYTPLSPSQQHRARLAVARHATDPDDCRALLEMLNLAVPPEQP